MKNVKIIFFAWQVVWNRRNRPAQQTIEERNIRTGEWDNLHRKTSELRLFQHWLFIVLKLRAIVEQSSLWSATLLHQSEWEEKTYFKRQYLDFFFSSMAYCENKNVWKYLQKFTSRVSIKWHFQRKKKWFINNRLN